MSASEDHSDRARRWDTLERLFGEASALPPEERDAFLERACAHDPTLHSELRSLLPYVADETSPLPPIAHLLGSDHPPGVRSDAWIGRELLHYSIEEQLGRGGMGVVYRARDTRLDRPVALKFLSPDNADPSAKTRFLQEARAAAAIDHPNICTVHEVGETADGTLFIAMAYYEGETLKALLSRGPLPIETILEYVLQIALGIEAAHERGIVHRDIKPANVLITRSGTAKLLDFGVAKVADASITQSGAVVGTAAYMSPEQVRGLAVDARTDIWSLGVVLYECIAGHAPFKGSNDAQTIHAITTEDQPPLPSPSSAMPTGIERLIRSALSKDLALRPQSAGEFIARLRIVMRGGEPGIPPRLEPRPRMSRARIVGSPRARGIAAVGALVVATLGYLTWPGAAAPALEERPVYLVLAHSDEPGEARKAEELTRQLNQWQPTPAAVLPQPVPVGGNGASLPLEQALAIAREMRTDTLVLVTTESSGDTTRTSAQLYSLRDARPERAFVIVGSSQRDQSLVTFAHRLLGLHGDPGEIEQLKLQSPRHAAVREVLAGKERLERTQWKEALAHFGRALALDSTFASAHHYQAVALYWSEARAWNPNRFAVSARIRRGTAAAVRHARAVPLEHSVHFRAFDWFERGEYDSARALYSGLLQRDSSDVYAWLGIGMVESDDPWAERTEWGELRPRGNITLAMRAFREALRRQPEFFLGYGHLFDTYLNIGRATATGACPGFEVPRDEVILPWEARIATLQVSFCPTYSGDSVRWTRWEDWPLHDRRLGAVVADTIMARARRDIERWSAFAPNSRGPHEVWTSWWLARRSGVPRTVDRSAADSFATEALRHASRALALHADTARDDLVRLGVLHLAAGDPSTALTLTRRAIDRRLEDSAAEERSLPPSSANPLLAAGQLPAALEIVEEHWRRWFSYGVHDPVENRLLQVPDVSPVVARIHVLGAVGYDGAALTSAFGELERAWQEYALDERQIGLMRGFFTRYVSPALVLNDSVLVEWFRDQRSVPLLWRAHLSAIAQQPDATQLLDRYVAQMGAGRVSPQSAYLAGRLAQRLGRHAAAVELFSRMDSAILDVGNVDPGWGLLSLSYVLRARSLEALGMTDQARTSYRRFVHRWQDAESTPWLGEANAALARLDAPREIR